MISCNLSLGDLNKQNSGLIAVGIAYIHHSLDFGWPNKGIPNS